MPKALERELKAAAEKKYHSIKDIKRRTEKINAYVYGTMRATGWKPARERR